MESKERIRSFAVLSLMCLVSSTFAQCPTAVCDCNNYGSRKEIRCSSRNLASIPNNLPADTLVLRLEFNQITSISATDLSHLTQLKKLTLYNNMISYIDASAFQNQQNLGILSLQNNMIASLHWQTFRYTTKLVQLDLDNNQLTTFQNGTFQSLAKLTDLAVPGNPLQSLPYGIFSDLSNLQRLDISKVNFKSIPETLFDGLTSLDTLKMNNVTQNGDDIFSGENLFQSIANITTLEIQKNALTCIPAACSLLRALEVLKLSLNPLTCGNFSGLHNLVNLEELHMEDSRLTRLSSGMFAGNRNLLFLLIENSNLIEIEEDAFKGLGLLEDLILYGNNLTTLPTNIFDPLPTNAALDLASNPWNCDCNFRWFHEWITNTYTGDVQDDVLPACATPARLENQGVVHIDDLDFACMPVSDVTNMTHSVNQGENFVLRCGITGDPSPDLHWLTPDHTQLRPDTNQGPFIVDADCTLTIVRIQENDVGAYSCVGTNAVGTVSVRNMVTVNPTGIERPPVTTKATPQTSEMTAPHVTTSNSEPSTGNKDSTVIIIVVIGIALVLIVFIAMIVLCKKHRDNKNRRSHGPDVGIVYRNEPLTGNCAGGMCPLPPNPNRDRYAETLPRIPDTSPLDLPPPYSTIPPQSTYDEIYDRINDDNTYERPRQPGDMSPYPARLNHAYMSQMQRQDSCVSADSCGAQAMYERSLFRVNSAHDNLYTSDTGPAGHQGGGQVKPGQLDSKKVAMQESNSDLPQKQKLPPDAPGVNVTKLDPNAKVLYQNTRRK